MESRVVVRAESSLVIRKDDGVPPRERKESHVEKKVCGN
jgi:hypothetical protein